MRYRARDGGPDLAGRQWDAFVTGGAPAPDDPFIPTISRLHAADTAPAVDPTFAEELLARLITGQTANISTIRQQEMSSMETAIRPAPLRRPPAASQRPSRPERRGWMELPAMLVVIAIVLGAVFFDRGPRVFKPKQEGVVIPAASIPEGLETPEIEVAGPVLPGQARGNAARTGEYPGSGPVTQPEIVWQKEMPGARINPLMAVDDGRIFLLKSPMEEEGPPQLWAFDLRSGETLWTFPVGWTYNRMLAAANGWVYISRTDDRAGEQPERLVALNAETGEEQWTYPIGVAQRSTLAIANGTVYAIGGDQTLHAIDAVTGRDRWTFELTGNPSANPGFSWELESPAVAEGTVYAPAIGGVLYAIDAETGVERWRVDTDSDNLATPAVDDGVVYLNSVVLNESKGPIGRAYALDTSTGVERWRADTGALQTADAPVVGQDLIFLSGARDPSVAQTDDESMLSACERATVEL
jgi:outer membrane protein assembly factor BamB